MRSFFVLISIALFSLPAFFCKGYSARESFYSDYLKGAYSRQKQDLPLAQKYLEKAKEGFPDSVYLYHEIANILIQQEKTEEAEEVLKKAKEIDPDDLDTYLALIFIYSYQGQDQKLEDEYEDFLKKAYQKKPQNVTVSSYLAQFYFYQDKLTEAITVYEAILKNNPENLEAFFWLGYLRYQVGEEERAIEIWEDGLALDPDYHPILNALGYTYAQRGIHLSKAKEMIEKALEEEPDNGAYLDSLGWVYYKKGKLEKAKNYIKKALDKTEDPEIYYHLGVIYMDLGKEEKGLEIYKKGLEKFPEYQELKEEVDKYEEKNKKNKE